MAADILPHRIAGYRREIAGAGWAHPDDLVRPDPLLVAAAPIQPGATPPPTTTTTAH